MAAGFFAPDGANAQPVRPLDQTPTVTDGWFQDVTAPGSGNGTVITATILNQIIANLREVVTALGGTADGSDDMLRSALAAGLLEKSVYDPTNVAGDAFSMDNMAETANSKVLSAAERTKLTDLTLTAPVDLDAIAARVIDIDQAVVMRGAWDASSSVFPSTGGGAEGGAIRAGDSFYVSVGDTVDGEVFQVNDRLLALIDSPSTTTLAGNWLHLDYTDMPQNTFVMPLISHSLFGGL